MRCTLCHCPLHACVRISCVHCVTVSDTVHALHSDTVDSDTVDTGYTYTYSCVCIYIHTSHPTPTNARTHTLELLNICSIYNQHREVSIICIQHHPYIYIYRTHIFNTYISNIYIQHLNIYGRPFPSPSLSHSFFPLSLSCLFPLSALLSPSLCVCSSLCLLVFLSLSLSLSQPFSRIP